MVDASSSSTDMLLVMHWLSGGQLGWPASIMGLQKVEKEVWHRSTLGAALPQLVGHIVGDVARPSLVAA